MTDAATAPAQGAPHPHRLPLVAALVAVAVLVVGTIGPPLFGKGVFLAVDQLTLAYPWRAFDSPSALNVLHHGPATDTIDANHPTRVLSANALRDGHLFGWNPYPAGGTASASHSASGSLSPFGLLYVALPHSYAPAAAKLVQMLVAVGFTYLFCRRLGTGKVPAVFAGAAFAGSGFMVMWTNWPHPEVASVIPALFWATERFLQGPSARRLVPIALALGVMLLGNFPAVVGYALVVLAGYVLVRLWRSRGVSVSERLGRGAGVATGLVAGVLLVAVVLLPFAHRLRDLNLDHREQTTSDSVGLASLVTTVAPKALGLSTESVPWFGPMNQIEHVAFLGATTVLLALAAVCLPRPRSTPAGARLGLALPAAIIGVATYAGGPVLAVLVRLPLFSSNFIGRSVSVMGFVVAVLAGLGLQSLAERRVPQERRGRAVAAAAVTVTAVVGLLALRSAFRLADAVDQARYFARGFALPVAVGIAAVVLVVVVVRAVRPRTQQVAMAGIVGLLVVESLALSLPLLPNEDHRFLYPSTPGLEFLASQVDHDRVAPEGLTFMGNGGALFGIRSVTGHAFTAETWKEALRTIDPQVYAGSQTLSQLSGDESVITSPLLDRLGARWFAATGSHVPVGIVDGDRRESSSCDRPVLLDEPVTVTVPAGDGLRGALVRTCGTVSLPPGAALEVSVASAGATVASGRTHLPTTVGAVDIGAAVPADDLSGPGDLQVTFSMVDSGGHALVLATGPDGKPAVDPIRPGDDGLRLAYADDLRIYERTRALPRVRWAGRARVVPDRDDRLRVLAGGLVPDDTVVLSEPGPLGSGEPGAVEVLLDAPTAIDLRVEAEGDGYVVVADALQSDWVATVDGERAELVDADHAGVAVAVPAGEHTVELRYEPRGQRLGMVLSTLTAIALVACAATPWLRRRLALRRHRA